MMRNWIDRRTVLKGLASAPLAAGLAMPALAQSREPVKFLLDWTWWPPQIPLLVAHEKGFFGEAGLEVEMRQGAGSGTTCQVVGQGSYDIGHVNLTTAAQSIARGIPIKSVATIANKGASALVFKKGTIGGVEDLLGKRIGTTAGGSDAQILPAFFTKNGIEESQVTLVNLPGDAKLGALLTGQIDVVSGDGYYYIALAAEKGVELEQLLFGDFEANTIGYGLISNTTFIDTQPDRIRRFVDACLEGYRYTNANMDEAIAIYRRISGTEQTDETIHEILKGFLDLIKSGVSDDRLYSGANDPQVWAGTLEILSAYGGLSSDKEPSEYWTNAFVPS